MTLVCGGQRRMGGGQQAYAFKKECVNRHNKRDDTKLRDIERLRTTEFKKLRQEARAEDGVSKSQARRNVAAFLKAAVEDVIDTMVALSPDLVERLKGCLRRYAAVKEGEALGWRRGAACLGDLCLSLFCPRP